MRFITHKMETLRRAVAESVLRATESAIWKLEKNELPKKDALAVARVAGIMAAKKTHEIIPHCHPLLIEGVSVDFTVEKDRVTVRVLVETSAKTGVEMEALCAASAAVLTLYDMLKPVEQDLEILNCRLIEKTGGKSDFTEKISNGFKAAVLVSSDGTAKGTRQDKSGRLIQEKLRTYGIEPEYLVLPDDQKAIAAQFIKWCDEKIELIVSTGGTGLGPRDVTVEAARSVIEREIPGIMEAARGYGQRRTPYAMLSRGIAGQRDRTILLTLPGSSKGVEESLNALFPAVFHAYKMMQGGSH